MRTYKLFQYVFPLCHDWDSFNTFARAPHNIKIKLVHPTAGQAVKHGPCRPCERKIHVFFLTKAYRSTVVHTLTWQVTTISQASPCKWSSNVCFPSSSVPLAAGLLSIQIWPRWQNGASWPKGKGVILQPSPSPSKPFHLKMFSEDGRSPGSTFCHKLLVQNWLNQQVKAMNSWWIQLRSWPQTKASERLVQHKEAPGCRKWEVWEAVRPAVSHLWESCGNPWEDPKNFPQIFLFKDIPPKQKTQWGALALRWAAAAISPCASLLQTKF